MLDSYSGQLLDIEILRFFFELGRVYLKEEVYILSISYCLPLGEGGPLAVDEVFTPLRNCSES